MIKNQSGFIPKRYRQPLGYKRFFNNWNAIYIHPKTGEKYYLELYSSVCSNFKCANEIQILKQAPNCRTLIKDNLKTIKAAIETLEKIFNKEI